MPSCPSCSAETPRGARWCSLCHVNLVNPEIGRLASPGKRLGACLLDVLVPFFVFILILLPVIVGAATETEAGAGIGSILTLLLFVAYIVWAFVLFARGTTPGKKLLGMRVVKEDGGSANFFTMLIREWIGKTISGVILLLGFLWILFDQDNQGWHDKLVSTYVVE